MSQKSFSFLGAFLLVLAAATPAHAQEARATEEARVAALDRQVVTLYRQGNYVEASQVAMEALRIAEATFGPEHANTAPSLNNLAELYRVQGKYGEAEPLYKRSLAIKEKALGPEHPGVAISLNNLAALYDDQGRHADSEPLWRRALAIREKAFGPDHRDVAQSLNNLAELYRVQGKYAEAEPLYHRAIAIREKALGPEHPDAAISLNNLALLYEAQGKYGEAEPLYRRALAIREKALGPDHPDTAGSLNNLAELYRKQGRYFEVEPLLRRVLSIHEKVLGPDHPYVALSLNNLAGLYDEQGRYAEAEPLYRGALAIREKALGPEHPDLAATLNNLALLYMNQGKYAEAELFFRRPLAILERALGPEHPLVGGAFTNLAALYMAEGKYAEAEPLFDRALQNLATQFEQQFAYMSEKERVGFRDSLSGNFSLFLSFCFNYREQSPGLVGKMYDTLLWEKGLVATSVTDLRSKIAASGDQEALAVLEKLAAKKTQLAAQSGAPTDNPEQSRAMEQLRHEANDLERELVKRSAALAEEKKLARITWRGLQQALKKDEAAVEIVRFPFHDRKKWTDTYYYAVLVITPETTAAPKFVLLGEASKLEGGPLAAYQQHVGLVSAAARGARGVRPIFSEKPTAAPPIANFYEAFWKPLEAALGNAKRVFLSPDGVLNQVSLGVVPAADGRLLLEKYDLRIVSSTKDLLRQSDKSVSNTAVLVGNPDFGLDETRYRAALKSAQRTEVAALKMASGAAIQRSAELRGSSLNPLPGTQVEVEVVSSMLNKQRWKVEVLTQQNALEETVKRVRTPRVLHVATHGFFESDLKPERWEIGNNRPSGLEDPMLRSGLYFAGADRALTGKTAAADLDDGVLTAYEATQLDLHGTELVVLSACGTGLGETAAGEGVFGLRRALQVAGAEAVLMSMWAVPDKETQELMALFYEKWLAGEDKHQALREAQLEMRERVKKRYGEDRPRLWGAFVLVGR